MTDKKAMPIAAEFNTTVITELDYLPDQSEEQVNHLQMLL